MDDLDYQELNQILKDDQQQRNASTELNTGAAINTQAQDGAADSSPPKYSRAWIGYAFTTALCFTACNTTISRITQEQGPLCLLYFSFGSMIAGSAYNLYHCTINFKKPNGQFWVDQNLKVDGRIVPSHVIGFILFCIVYFLIQNMAFLTMWFATLAKINVGVITVIWSLNPFYNAIADYFVFGTKLKYFHFVGMILIVSATILIALQPFILNACAGKGFKAAGTTTTSSSKSSTLLDDDLDSLIQLKPVRFDVDDDISSILSDDDTSTSLFSGLVVEPWVPVVFGIVTPITFTLNGILIRKLTNPDYGFNFNGTDLSFTAYFFTNLLIIIFAIVWWQINDYDEDMFLLGTIGSIINTVGISLSNKAISIGPLGPVSAITCMANIFLVIVEAIRNFKLPTWVEFVALALGFAGSLELVFPQFLESACCKKKSEEEQDDSKQEEQAMTPISIEEQNDELKEDENSDGK